MTKTYKDLNEQIQTDVMRSWIIKQIEQTEKTHDQIKKEFLKKYPGRGAFFDQVVKKIVD